MANQRKRKVNQPNWCNFPPELLDLILKKLSFANKFRFQGVCNSWLAVAKTHISSLFRKYQSQTPLIMISSNQVSEHNSFGRYLYNPEKKQLQNTNNFPREFHENHCIGSSNGWLVFLDEKDKNHYLFNPILEAGIKVHNLPVLQDISKIVLWSDPILSNDYGIVAIYGFYNSTAAYAKSGDDKWSYLHDDDDAKNASCYNDIVCRKGLVYTLNASFWVEAWDLSTSNPKKVMTIHPGFKFIGTLDYQLYDRKLYLIVSQGELLLVTRDIGYHVRDDGLVVQEGDMIDHQHVGFRFRCMTKFINVFKLDFNKIEWVQVEHLGDRVVFLGTNQSVLVQAEDFKEYEKNSVYFMDDRDAYLKEMDDECDDNDTGIYSLKNRSIDTLFNSIDKKLPPFWVIPGL